MKTLKLILLMLLTANFVTAQTNTYSAPEASLGDRNAIIGVDAGINNTGGGNVYMGYQAGKNATNSNRSIFIGEGAGGNATGNAYKIAIGHLAGANSATGFSTYIGNSAGQNDAGGDNVFIGRESGKSNTTGVRNMFIGNYAGQNNLDAGSNTFIGSQAGRYNTTGRGNMFLGSDSGLNNLDGKFNLFVGSGAGKANIAGQSNVYLGGSSGSYNNGSNNVFIGPRAGSSETLTDVSNQLYIQNSNDIVTPLIYGDFSAKQLGIGTSDVPSDYTLAVKGHIVAEELTLSVYQDGAAGSGWPDYVFEEDYDLTPLNELEAQIETLGHLPGVPSAQEVGQNGHNAGEMDAILLEKVEELTLHLIEMDKTIKRLEKIEQELRQENEALRK